MLSICRICLRTDVELQNLRENEDLADFYEELCDYSIELDNQLICTECESILTKCYNFKLLCCKADEVLRNWKKKTKDKPSLQELYQNLPQNKDVPKLEHHIYVEDIKSEIPLEFIEAKALDNEIEQYNVITFDGNDIDSEIVKDDVDSRRIRDGVDSKDENDSKCINEDKIDIVIENINEFDKLDDSLKNDEYDQIDEIDDPNDEDYIQMETAQDDDDDEDKFLSLLKKEANEEREKCKEKVKRGKKDKGKKLKKSTIVYGNPIHNQKELEKTFDIEIFSSEVEAIRHFEQRCTTEPYVSSDYKCQVCYTVYMCQKKLDHHMKAHEPSVGDYVCNICQMRYKKNGQLLKHKTSVHYGVYKCKMCPLITYYKNVMLQHSDKHKGIEYQCEHCSRIFGHRNTYLTHLRTAHASDHICDVCAKTFVSEMGLLMHQSRAHNKVTVRKKRRIKAEKAKEETTIEPKSLTEDTATCNECNITFASHAVYIVHVLNTPKHKELASTIIACKFCGLEFSNRSNLIMHKRKMHLFIYKKKNSMKYSFGPEGKIFRCQECGVQGKSGLWLYRHHTSYHPHIPYEQHNDDRKHLCEQCGLSFYLYRHHTCYHPHIPYEQQNDDRKHLCEQCGLSFYTASALRHHNYKHTGDKPYGCEMCPAKFRTKIGLKSHAEIHMPPRRECTHCAKKFFTASSLSNHMRSHIGDRRYKCEICGKGFLHNAALREHVRGVHYHIKRQRKQTAITNAILQ